MFAPALADQRSGDVSRERTSVLFVTGHLPFPPRSGGRRREFELLQRLAPSVDVDLVAILKEPVENGAVEMTARCCRSVTVFPAEPDRSRRECCEIVRRHQSPAAAQHVSAALRSGVVDLVHVEGFYLADLVPDTGVPLVVAEQNVEYTLCEQRAAIARDANQRAAHAEEARRTRHGEFRAWERADLCVAVTDDDRAAMLRDMPGLRVEVVPDGADCSMRTGRGAGRGDVVFIANFAYEPNRDAAEFLCRSIWPSVVARESGARLQLVGYDAERLRGLGGRSVTVQGRVPSVEGFLAAADVIACPLRIGGGVKVKVLEALACGKPVVTTSVGAQGLASVVDAGGLLVCDEAEPFADAVVTLLRHPARRAALGNRGQAAVSRLPSWDDAAASLLQCYGQVVDLGAGTVERRVPA
jgi:glycosyltransferase involved in cell wall biosynthesis